VFFLAEVDGTNIEKWNMTELINVMILNTIFLIVYNQHIEEISYQNSWEYVAVVGAGWKLEEDILKEMQIEEGEEKELIFFILFRLRSN